MAASMWRMNGFWRRMAAVLLLCALLLHNGAVCQEGDTTEQPTNTAVMPSVDPTAPSGAPSNAPSGTLADLAGDVTATDPAVQPTANSVDATEIPDGSTPASGDPATAKPQTENGITGLAENMGPSTTSPDNTDAPGHPAVTDAITASDKKFPFTIGWVKEMDAGFDTKVIAITDAPIIPAVTETEALPVMPVVVCVTEEDLKDKDAVQVRLEHSSSCERSKDVLEKLLAPWCPSNPCQLDVFQEGSSKTLLVTSPHAGIRRLEEALNMVEVKEALGASEVEAHPGKSSSAVFVSVLMAGLLLAAGLIGAYCLRIRQGQNTKGMRLAEETYPVDEENQGNTLVSVAPLTPPECQEKPAVNGDAPEADKTQPPPTNGHSTKTADTEL